MTLPGCHEWDKSDDSRAWEDGWFITSIGTIVAKSHLSPTAIPKFTDNKAAHAHVVARAFEGSELHSKALSICIAIKVLS